MCICTHRLREKLTHLVSVHWEQSPSSLVSYLVPCLLLYLCGVPLYPQTPENKSKHHHINENGAQYQRGWQEANILHVQVTVTTELSCY